MTTTPDTTTTTIHGLWHRNITNEEHRFHYAHGDITWEDDGRSEPLMTPAMYDWLARQSPDEDAEQVFDTDAGPVVLTLFP
jgi:hypothetical protein